MSWHQKVRAGQTATLIIFDDEHDLLQRFERQYRAMGYDVVPVLVPGDLGIPAYFAGHVVQTKTQLRQLLQEVKPDCVLTDKSMRYHEDASSQAQQWEHDDVILGPHVMRMAAEMEPRPLCAMHSGEFTQFDDEPEVLRRVKESALGAARHQAFAEGYEVYPKDREGEGSTALGIHRYFQRGMAQGVSFP